MSTAKQRLAAARRSAEQYAGNNPPSAHYSDWRNWVSKVINGRTTSRDPEDRNVMYVDEMDALDLRHVGEAHKIISLRYTGWYADNDQHAMYVGQVYQLPARKGVEQYVPAIRHSDYGTGTLFLGEITSDKGDAARWADQNAEKAAEESREYDAKDAAEQQIAEAREEIHVINRQVLPALKELKGARLTPAICSMVRGGISELLAERRAAFKKITKLQDDFWQAVPQ